MQTDFLQVEKEDGLAIVWLDEQGRSVNTLSRSALDDFDRAMDEAQGGDDIEALVFISRKEDSFVVGADVEELKELDTPTEVEEISRTAHRLLARLRGLNKPTVAAIHGPAMGGGLEMTLGMDYRIATEHGKTKLALPEVKLGLLPGGGGTQYLPRLVGLQSALPIMLAGKNVYPRQARRMGLVDMLTHRDGLLQTAKAAARDLARGELTPGTDRRGMTDRLLESNPLSRRLVYRRAAAQLRSETQGNYPAPFKILDCVATGLEEGLAAGLDAEATAFGELAFTPEAKQLIFLFFAKQAAEKNPQPDLARDVGTVGVLGGGLMGGGIAQVSATGAMNVLIKDQSLDLAAHAKQLVWENIGRKAKKGAYTSFEHDLITERITPIADYEPLHQADLVIEAVPENLDVKHQVIEELEPALGEDCLLASNTSSLPIEQIAAASERPEQMLGMHYFSPVPSIPLLEIIRTEDTANWAVATAYEVGLRQGKTVIVVNDGPGFYTTRILSIYMNEALLLLEEGADIKQVDEAMEQFGFPMGPYALFDLVGLDTAAKITQVLGNFFGERVSISTAGDRLVEAELLGQKNGLGFYEYSGQGKGKRPKQGDVNEAVYRHFGGERRTKMNPELIQQRLALMMVNEAVRCFEDDVLTSPTDGDVGAVFGLGFPPFRGGPFRYVDTVGAETIADRMDRLKKAFGERFTPAPLLLDHGQNDSRFYEDDEPAS